MALLVCESLALQEASMALAEALLRCERKRFSFFVILSAVEGSRSMAWEVIWLEELKS